MAYPATALKGAPATTAEIDDLGRYLDEFVARQTDSAYLEALRNSTLANDFKQDRVQFYWGEAEVLYDHPEKLLHGFDKTEHHLSPQLAPHFDGVQQELIIFSPYFVPGKEGTAFLSELSERNVRVRILTNSLASTDVGIVHAGYIKYRKKLLRASVELYEMNKKLSKKEREEKKGETGSSKASLHAKSFVFDRKQVFIGSLNLDPRAIVHNTEIGVVFSSEPFAKEMANWFDQNIDQLAFRLELRKNDAGSEKLLWHGLVDGKAQVFDVEPYTGFWRRFGIGFMSLWPIESQL